MAKSTYLSIITLNTNGLNSPIKRHRVAEWVLKNTSYMLPIQESPQAYGQGKKKEKKKDSNINN